MIMCTEVKFGVRLCYGFIPIIMLYTYRLGCALDLTVSNPHCFHVSRGDFPEENTNSIKRDCNA